MIALDDILNHYAKEGCEWDDNVQASEGPCQGRPSCHNCALRQHLGLPWPLAPLWDESGGHYRLNRPRSDVDSERRPQLMHVVELDQLGREVCGSCNVALATIWADPYGALCGSCYERPRPETSQPGGA